MACFHPMKAFLFDKYVRDQEGKFVLSDKKKIVFPGKDHYDEVIYRDGNNVSTDFVWIPCGKCRGCRIDKSKEWANRCLLELGYHSSSYFLTITYNDGHIPTRYYGDSYTGECVPCNTLYKRDMQTWLKRLRKAHEEKYGKNAKIRFYLCGEYGDHTHRPHYHVICFGLMLDDLKVYKRSRLGYNYYTSEWLNSTWSFDRDKTERDDPDILPRPSGSLGYIVIAPVTWESVAYTARYTTKKLYGAASEYYDRQNIIQPFSLMSRRPGIAQMYFEDHPGCAEDTQLFASTFDDSKSFPPPLYFSRLLEKSDPVKFKELKLSKKIVSQGKILKVEKESKLRYDLAMFDREQAFLERIKPLRRDSF